MMQKWPCPKNDKFENIMIKLFAKSVSNFMSKQGLGESNGQEI